MELTHESAIAGTIRRYSYQMVIRGLRLYTLCLLQRPEGIRRIERTANARRRRGLGWRVRASECGF